MAGYLNSLAFEACLSSPLLSVSSEASNVDVHSGHRKVQRIPASHSPDIQQALHILVLVIDFNRREVAFKVNSKKLSSQTVATCCNIGMQGHSSLRSD